MTYEYLPKEVRNLIQEMKTLGNLTSGAPRKLKNLLIKDGFSVNEAEGFVREQFGIDVIEPVECIHCRELALYHVTGQPHCRDCAVKCDPAHFI